MTRSCGTTQRDMHLSPAALDAAIRLLEEPSPGPAKAGPYDQSLRRGERKDSEAKEGSAFALEGRRQVLRRDRLRW